MAMKLLGYSLRSPFYKQKPNTRLHPDFKKETELAFSIEGYGDLYMFKNPLDMPPLRHNKCARFIAEVENRFKFTSFIKVLDDILENANKGQLNKVVIKAHTTKEIINYTTDLSLVYRFLSCFFFTEEEDLKEYDFDYNEPKIEAFKKMGISFFLLEPIENLLNHKIISANDLAEIEILDEVRKKYMTSSS